jgi:hypothetical protein
MEEAQCMVMSVAMMNVRVSTLDNVLVQYLYLRWSCV